MRNERGRDKMGLGLGYEFTHFYISYHYLSIMPPKKKINKVGDEPAAVEPTPKPVEKVEPAPEQKKQEQKPEKQDKPEVKPAITPAVQSPAARLEQIIAQESTPKEASEPKAQKISIDDAAKLTEEERIKLRKLRFGTLGTDNTIQEAERIRQERLKKFGGASEEVDKETLEKRKQKFGNVPELGPQDPEIAKKRLEKFGSTGINLLSEDKSILQQRKKKFGNVETILTLDDEISKSKPIKKFHSKHNNHKRFHDSHDHRGRR